MNYFVSRWKKCIDVYKSYFNIVKYRLKSLILEWKIIKKSDIIFLTTLY